MNTIALSGDDSLTLKARNFSDLADGDFANLTFENDLANVTTGKNSNAIFSANATGRQGQLEIRVIRGSADDKFLNSQMAAQREDFAGFVLMTGEFIKKIGDSLGNKTNDTYILSGGIFKKQVEAKSNSEGDTEQSVSIYTIMFSNVVRVIS